MDSLVCGPGVIFLDGSGNRGFGPVGVGGKFYGICGVGVRTEKFGLGTSDF